MARSSLSSLAMWNGLAVSPRRGLSGSAAVYQDVSLSSGGCDGRFLLLHCCHGVYVPLFSELALHWAGPDEVTIVLR